LSAYLELVQAWAGRLDLVSPGDLARFRTRHIEDSLKAVPLLSSAPPGPAIDVGSGSGVPGIPLALAEPSRHWRLMEPRAKRAAFLEEAVRTLGLDCEVLRTRAEAAGRDPSLAGTHALATARALARPAEAFATIMPLVARGGVGIVWIGAAARAPSGADVPTPGLATMRAASGEMEENA
jgi:16S rRNA (guanine527-N7)-methyltransferase